MIFDPNMTSFKPYFIQALHQWISDNDLTPLIVIDAKFPGLRVPPGIEDEGKITLNVSWHATEHLQMDDELMTFSARFSGRSQALIVPMEAIISIFARENGKGMVFEVESEADFDEAEEESNVQPVEKVKKKTHPQKPQSDRKKPHLTIVD